MLTYLKHVEGREEVLTTPHGLCRVIKVKPNSNGRALTVEELAGRRKKLHLAAVSQKKQYVKAALCACDSEQVSVEIKGAVLGEFERRQHKHAALDVSVYNDDYQYRAVATELLNIMTRVPETARDRQPSHAPAPVPPRDRGASAKADGRGGSGQRRAQGGRVGVVSVEGSCYRRQRPGECERDGRDPAPAGAVPVGLILLHACVLSQAGAALRVRLAGASLCPPGHDCVCNSVDLDGRTSSNKESGEKEGGEE